MSKLFDLSTKYADLKTQLNRTKEEIREFAASEGYEESAYIGDPIHFEVGDMRFTPKRVCGTGSAKAPDLQSSEGESTETMVEVEASGDESLDETLSRIESSGVVGQEAQPGEMTTHFGNGASVTERDDGSMSIREP